MNRMYERLSGIRFLSRSYTFKFLFIAFLGIHIPLIGLVVFVLFRPDGLTTFSVLMLTLVLTLGATAVTLIVMNGLLVPLRKSRQALDTYIRTKELPQLPVHFRDEAGILMNNIQLTITELNDLLQEKEDLASLLSHDLRTPVFNIKSLVELIREEGTSPKVDDFMNMILSSTEEQIVLLDHVLDMLRQDHLINSGAGYQPVKTNALIDETIGSFAAQAREKNISLKKQVEYDGAITVQPDMFRQVLKNLVSNAIKFSYEGSEVSVAVRKRDSRTLIEVQDKGMGFEPMVSERLFDRFTRNGRIGTAGESSTGIGLHLSRKIIKHHKGDLVAVSTGPGKGSTFTISL